MKEKAKDGDYSLKEAMDRFEKTVRAALTTEPKPLKDIPPSRKRGRIKRGKKSE